MYRLQKKSQKQLDRVFLTGAPNNTTVDSQKREYSENQTSR